MRLRSEVGQAENELKLRVEFIKQQVMKAAGVLNTCEFTDAYIPRPFNACSLHLAHICQLNHYTLSRFHVDV
jgi:hypothetical protein